MPVLFTINFDNDSIKNELKAVNSVISGLIWPKFELIRDFMHVLDTYKRDQIKSNREKLETQFSPF